MGRLKIEILWSILEFFLLFSFWFDGTAFFEPIFKKESRGDYKFFEKCVERILEFFCYFCDLQKAIHLIRLQVEWIFLSSHEMDRFLVEINFD